MRGFIEVTESTNGKKVSVNVSTIISVEPDHFGTRIMTSDNFLDSGIWATEKYIDVVRMIERINHDN